MAILGDNQANGIYQLSRPLLKQNPAQPATTQTSRSAPVKGWNTRDSLANMDLGFAVQLDNWIPREDTCEVRPGQDEHATGCGTTVESLMHYSSPTVDHILAASGSVIYDATTPGVASSLSTGKDNARWQHVNFNDHLMMVNGGDVVQKYEGSTVSESVITGTGLSSSADLINIAVHANRLWFTEKQSLSAWYLPVENIAGVAVKFDISFYTQLGGYLMAIGSWSRDGGAGPDDYIVFITSEGEVIVYSGTNPASDFAVVGRFLIGKPIGRRCTMKLGAELIILTQDGYVDLKSVLSDDRAFIHKAISDPIRPSVRHAYRNYGAMHGWSIEQWADQNLMIVNVPTAEGDTAEQHVVNTINGSWCRWTDLGVLSMAVVGDDFYYGTGDGKVRRMDGDIRSDDGNAIVAKGAAAWDYLNARGRTKQLQLQRHQLLADGNFSATIGVDVDFKDNGAESVLTITTTSGEAWDVATWDVSAWGDEAISNEFVGASGNGYAFSPTLEVSVNNVRPKWISYDLVWTNGSVI